PAGRRCLPHRGPHLLHRGRAARPGEPRTGGQRRLGPGRGGDVPGQVALQPGRHGGDHGVVVAGRQRLQLDHVPGHAQTDDLRSAQCGPQLPAVHPQLADEPAEQHGLDEVPQHAHGVVVGGDAADQCGELPAAVLVPHGEEPADDALAQLLRIAGQQLGDQLRRVHRQRHRRGEQAFLVAEPVVDHGRVHPGARGDAAHRGAFEPLLDEHLPGGGEQGVPGVFAAAPAPPALPSSPLLNSLAAHPFILPGARGERQRTGGGGEVGSPGRHNDSMVGDGEIGSISPGREEFRELAKGRRVIPVVRRLLADDEAPLGVYRKLAGDRPGTFLFESAENGRSWSRWSFVGVRSAAALTVRDGAAHWMGTPPVGLPQEGDPLHALRETVRLLHTDPLPGLPPLTGGMVGYLGYDIVRRLERLPELTEDDLQIPEMMMLLATDMAALDHHEGTITLIANAVNWDDSPERVDAAYDDAVRRLDEMTEQLFTPAEPTVAVFSRPQPQFHRQRTQEEHFAAVEKAKEAIRAGEAFQVVASQRFEMPTSADALDIYRVLRTTNPSPYMYLLRLQAPEDDSSFAIVGSSPESLVTVRDGQATTHPIAGTRWRGADADEDARLEKELLNDEKERAEHLMLVDLGRNDLGRVCRPGSVRVL